MRVIIAGGRTIRDYRTMLVAINTCPFKAHIETVLSGGARGADALGARWAEENRITVVTFEAKWDIFGKSAGPMRNWEMANLADGLILVWDGKSKGSASMLAYARKCNLKIHQHIVTGEVVDL